LKGIGFGESQIVGKQTSRRSLASVFLFAREQQSESLEARNPQTCILLICACAGNEAKPYSHLLNGDNTFDKLSNTLFKQLGSLDLPENKKGKI
jgi:hypothetical protein